MEIRSRGAQLVSATENIDETPSGLLLHGIMASIAEFYSRNLATEIMKGTTQKAEKGGTPYRAPIGYLNSRDLVDGREIRTITIDPERAPLIHLAFDLYATGDYSLIDLATILEARGLRSRPSRTRPAKVLGPNRLCRRSFATTTTSASSTTPAPPTPAVTEPLVDEATFDKVQDILDAQRPSGERSWRHHHYLRGTLVCARVRPPAVLHPQHAAHGGTYDYFICGGRTARICHQPHHRAEAVEAAIERALRHHPARTHRTRPNPHRRHRPHRRPRADRRHRNQPRTSRGHPARQRRAQAPAAPTTPTRSATTSSKKSRTGSDANGAPPPSSYAATRSTTAPSPTP